MDLEIAIVAARDSEGFKRFREITRPFSGGGGGSMQHFRDSGA